MNLANVLLLPGNLAIRRFSWPAGVCAMQVHSHQVGCSNMHLTDVSDTDPEPRGWNGRLTLVLRDPLNRILPRKEVIPNTMYRPEQPVYVFHIPDWMPSVADLTADDWEVASDGG